MSDPVRADLPTAAITIVRPDQRTAATAQTSGSQRLAAFDASSGVSGLWAGVFEVQPGEQTGIHHHGQQETIVYVLEGEALVRWGDRGEHRAIARTGDFLHVPGWLVHQEINPSPINTFRWVVVRSSATPIVVNLPDTHWD